MSIRKYRIPPTSPHAFHSLRQHLRSSIITIAFSGGEEVLLDVAGQEATEAFEDVGHSDEARGILDGMLIGTLKREEGDSKKQGSTDRVNAGPGSKGQGAGPDTSSGIALYAIILVGGLLAFGAYQYFGKQDTK